MTASFTPRGATLKSRMASVGAIAVAGALLLTGCGDQTDKATGGSNTNAAPLFNQLPKEIQSAKVIKVGSDINYPPVEFKKNGEVMGIDPDIADALGKQLGVKFEFNNGTFDTLLSGLRSKRYDIAMSAMTDNKGRQEGVDPDTGKKAGEGVDFVDYFTAGVSIYTKKGANTGIKTWDDLCGKKIVVQRGTVSHDLAKSQSKTCQKNGKGKISVEAFGNDTEAQTRLRGGGAVGKLQRLPGRRVRREDLRRRQGLRARRRAGGGGPVRHRHRQEEHPAARRHQAGPRPDHRERRIRQDHREVGRQGRRGHQGRHQRRQVIRPSPSALALKGTIRDDKD